MTFRLELQAAWNIGDSFATIVSTVKTGIRTTPDLVNDLILVSLNAVKVYGHHCFFDKLAVFELPHSGKGGELLAKYGIDAAAIVAAVKRVSSGDGLAPVSAPANVAAQATSPG